MNEIFILKREVRYPDKRFRCTIDKDVFFFKNMRDINRAWADMCMYPVRNSELCSNWRAIYPRRKRRPKEDKVYGFLCQRLFDDDDYYWMLDDDLFIFATPEERDRQFEIHRQMEPDDVLMSKFEKDYGYTFKKRKQK